MSVRSCVGLDANNEAFKRQCLNCLRFGQWLYSTNPTGKALSPPAHTKTEKALVCFSHLPVATTHQGGAA